MKFTKFPFRGGGKKLQAGKPDSVVGYHLSVPTVAYETRAAYPVSRTSSPQRYYMWHFSMQGLPANDVTIKSCELLPHIFTLPSPLLH